MKKVFKVFAIMLLLVACFMAIPACGELHHKMITFLPTLAVLHLVEVMWYTKMQTISNLNT